MALASPVTHASPAAVTALRKRKGSATTTNFNDSESEHIIKLPKRRRGNAELPSKVDLGAKPSNLSKSQMLSGSKGHERPRTVPKAPRSPNTNQSRPQNSSSKINDHTVDKSRQIPGSPGPAVDLRESPILHTWRQPPVSRISINSTDDDSIPHIRDPDLDSLRALDNRSTQEQAATTTNVNEAGANALKVKDSISSAVPKERKKKMVWNCECDFRS